jgi:hypothetical protein
LLEHTKRTLNQQWYRQLETSDRIAERNKTNKGPHSREERRKMAGGKGCMDNFHVA